MLALKMRKREMILAVFFAILTLTFDWDLGTLAHVSVGIAIGASIVAGIRR